MHRLVGLVTVMLACAWTFGTTASADIGHGTPNDPYVFQCESQSPLTGCGDNEEWDMYGPLSGNTCPDPVTGLAILPHPDGGLPCWAVNAHDPQHAAGMDLTGAWKQGNVGRDDVLVAYIEGGTNWSNDGVKDAIDNFYLNRGELPYPERADGTVNPTAPWDGDGNDGQVGGHFDVRDYLQDP